MEACEVGEERGGEEGEKERKLVKSKREGALGSEAGLALKHCSLSSASLRNSPSPFSLPPSLPSFHPSLLLLLSLVCSDPDGRLGLLSHLKRRIDCCRGGVGDGKRQLTDESGN